MLLLQLQFSHTRICTCNLELQHPLLSVPIRIVSSYQVVSVTTSNIQCAPHAEKHTDNAYV